MTTNFMTWQGEMNADRIIKGQRHHIEFVDEPLQSVDMDSAYLSMELQYESAQIMNGNTDRLITAEQ